MRIITTLLLLSIFFSACRKHELQRPEATATEDTSGGLPQNIYKVTVYEENPRKAIYLLSPYLNSSQDKGRVMIFDERGRLLQEKLTEGGAFCFRRWVINGKIRYTYIVNDPKTKHLPFINQLTGYAVIADSALNEIKRVHLHTHNDIIAGPDQVDLDVHDFILLSDDHYITMAYYPKKVTNIPEFLMPHPDLQIVANIIQEVKNDQVIWQWDGTEYPEFYTVSIEGNNYTDSLVPQDYMHMNSMVIDPRDNNLVCSYRNLDQVLKIERNTGKILWRLGGKNGNIPLSATQRPQRQHDAQLIGDDGNTVLLFDNGNMEDRPFSRILEFTLNETTQQVQAFSSYDIPAPFSRFMGSVQKTKSGNYFIGGGTAGYAIEINPVTNKRLIEFLGIQSSYRAYKYELE